MTIGGFFCFDPLPEEENNYISNLGGDVRYLMSGRCAIYYALQDLMLTDQKRVAYLPAYTCETVIGAFEKAGYSIYYYEVDKHFTPIFDHTLIPKISVLSLCGYYGFCSYDREFVARCAENKVCIMEDITHSAFSKDGIDPLCDYVVGSFRKWIGVPAGGIAIKTKDCFTLPMQPVEETHLAMRIQAMEMKEKALAAGQPDVVQVASDLFWDAELMLRQIFDANQSDERSIEIIKHYPFEEMISRRRRNYQYLLSHQKPTEEIRPAFLVLTVEACPSHFTVLAKERDRLQNFLKDQGISATVYWPVPPSVDLKDYPQAQYIYDHVLSIPCDQRYDFEDMERICMALSQF